MTGILVVRVFGMVAGRRVERRWTLIADRGCGPEIPTLAAALLAERVMEGACAAGELLALADFEPLFGELEVRHEVREVAQPDPLHRRIMGPQFDLLSSPLREMHGVLRDGGGAGRATVTRGRNPIARLVAGVIGFPPAGEHALHVSFAEEDGVETWTRDFSGQRFRSQLSQKGDALVERFGPLRFRFALVREGEGLRMVLRGWSCLGLPLPLVLAPRSDALEREDAQGRFAFEVTIALPLVGAIVGYRGWLI